MTIALSGRRIDAEHSKTSRFPLENVEFVRQALRDLFIESRADTLVSSAACGADLLALEEAGKLGMRRRIVLPFAPEQFLQSSVMDRPGDWRGAFERAIAGSDVVVLESGSYAGASQAILDEAAKLGDVTAVVVWDGKSRGNGDVTESFGVEAGRRGFPVIPISTLQNPSQRAISGVSSPN